MKLQYKLFLPLLLIVTLPILAMGLGAYMNILDSSTHAIINDVDSVTRSLRPTINEKLTTAENNLRLITRSRLIKDYVGSAEQRHFDLKASLLEQLSEYQDIYPEYFAMNLILENGMIDLGVDNRVGIKPELDATQWLFYQRLLDKTDLKISAFIETESNTGRFKISLALPLTYESKINKENVNSESKRSFFTLSLYLDYIQAIIDDVNYTQENLMVVTDSDGQIVFNNGQFGLKKIEESLHIAFTEAGYYQLNNKKDLFYLTSTELLYGLRLHVAVPISKFNDSANALAFDTALGLSTIILVIFLLSLSYIQKLLLTPIYIIKKLVKDITDGVMDTPISLRTRSDELGQLTKSIVKMRSKIDDNNQRIETLAYYDDLTTLPNRYLFQQKLDNQIVQAKQQNSMFAVVFLDLDNFKVVNDTLGHDIGDKLLVEASSRIMHCFSIDSNHKNKLKDVKISMLARLGGDEFTLLLPAINHLSELTGPLGNLIRVLSAPFKIEGHEILVGASVGASLYPFDGLQRKELLKNADIAMYESKKLGKNCFTFFDVKMKHKAIELQLIESSMLKAIDENEFSIEYQPRIKIDDFTIEGFEALLRWDNKDLGRIPPEKFIPIAESNLQILEIGRWVLNESCAKIRKWIDSGYTNFRLSINVSAIQLYRANLVEEIEFALASNNIQGEYLEIEITETAILEDEDLAIAKLRRIKELGIRISLDDFGTGYSSLSHLRKLPIDVLKIDRSFLSNITKDKDTANVFKGIMQLAKRLRLTTVAEGVEKLAQHEVILLAECDHAQGFYYSRPLPEKLADEYVKDGIIKQRIKVEGNPLDRKN